MNQIAARQRRTNDQLDVTRERLRTWGWWLAQIRSPVGGMITVRYQQRGAGGEITGVEPDHPTAERIDRILAAIQTESSTARKRVAVLRLYYDPRQNLSMREIALRLDIGETKAKESCLVGEVQVADYWRLGYAAPTAARKRLDWAPKMY
jgi:hypothetical protein